MKLVDSNVWLALAIPGHAHHATASDWFSVQDCENGLLFCRATQQAFLRLLTTRAVLNAYGSPPLTNEQAWEVYDGLTNDRRVGFLQEATDLQVSWQRLSSGPFASPKLWMDAYLAALAMSSGNRFVTIDRDFNQFSGLELQML